LRKYQLLVNGEPLGTIAHGETVRLDVAPGLHAVQAKLDWTRTPAVEFDIAEDETVELRVAPGSGFAILDVVRPSKYLVLERVESGQSPA
jgi:hypothetical protein